MKNHPLFGLFVHVLAIVRDILAHPECTPRLQSVLAKIITESYNEHFSPHCAPGDAAQTLRLMSHLMFDFQFPGEAENLEIQLPKSEGAQPLPVLFDELGATLAEILAHPETAIAVQENLGSLPVDLANAAATIDNAATDAIATRLMLPAYLKLFAGLDFLSHT